MTVQQAHDLRMAGEKHVRFLVARKVDSFNAVQWVIRDQQILTADGSAFEVGFFSTEDLATAAVDTLNANRGSGIDEIRQKVHPLN